MNDIERNNNSPSLLANLKILIVDWFLSSTAHALPNIFRNDRIFIKIMWIICFFISFGICFTVILMSITDFYKFSTTISTEKIQEIPTNFPAITFCNLKYFNYISSKDFIDKNAANSSIVGRPALKSLIQLSSAREVFLNNNYYNESMRQQMGFELKNMLLTCLFNYNTCEENEFFYFFHSKYGNCYTFNSGFYNNNTLQKIKTVSAAGELYGFTLELFLGDPAKQTIYQYNDGIIMSIHNQSSKPFIQGDIIKVAANEETDLIITRNFISKLDSPYSECLKDISNQSTFNSLYFDYIVRDQGSTYSQKYCFAMCTSKIIYDVCNCSFADLPTYKDAKKICIDLPLLCSLNLINKFGETEYVSQCEKACPLECDYIEYTITSYKALYPNYYYVQNFLSQEQKIKGSNISNENLYKSVLKVNTYYKNMDYVSTIEQASTELGDLISNIGGILGLFLGISFLSFIEIFELLIKMFLLVVGSIKKNKTNDNFVS